MSLLTVSVTKKGQATIPKKLRNKFGIEDKVVVIETEEGILLKPPPRPEEDFGSLKQIFEGKSSKEVLSEARIEDARRDSSLLKRIKK